MRTSLLLGLLGYIPHVVAQSWCPPGAIWTYEEGSGLDTYRMEHRYIGDSLLDGHAAQHIFVTAQGLVDFAYHEFTYADDEVVYARSLINGGGQWDTLYWFGAQIGDRWWPIGHPQNCPPLGMLQITATGDTVIQGVSLMTRTVVVLDEDGVPMPETFSIIERIGMVPRYPFIHDCEMMLEHGLPSIVCYSDEEIQIPVGEECQLTIGVRDLFDRGTLITLHPNPGTTFQLTGLGQRPALLRLLDVQGRTVREGIPATKDTFVDLGELHPGTYLVEVQLAAGRREVVRWVRE